MFNRNTIKKKNISPDNMLNQMKTQAFLIIAWIKKIAFNTVNILYI